MKCTGTTKAKGKPCELSAMRGGKVCHKHGGKAPQVKAAAERRLATRAAEADAYALLAHEGIEGITDPVIELARLATASKALCEALGQRVQALGSVGYRSAQGTEQLRSEVALWERAMDRTARFLEVLAKLGFQERTIQISEHIAGQVSDVLKAILADLHLTPHQEQQVPAVVSKHFLRLVPGEAS